MNSSIFRSALVIRVVLLSFALSATGCVVIPIADLLKPKPVKEHVLTEGKGVFGKDKIAVIQIEGVIASRASGNLLSLQVNSVNELHERLKQVRDDSRVKALVLRISSPGGEVTACDVMHQEILRLKSDREIPVLASIVDVGASGGYYVALAADEIYARRTAVVGSIGVLIQSLNVAGLFDKIGLEMTTVKSVGFKDLVSPYKASRPEEIAVLQDVVTAMHERFVDIVDVGRPKLGRSAVSELADGKVYVAEKALDLGLVDKIGGLNDVLVRAAELADIQDPTVVTYRRDGTSSDAYTIQSSVEGTRMSSDGQGLSMNLQIDTLPRTRFLYLWAP